MKLVDLFRHIKYIPGSIPRLSMKSDPFCLYIYIYTNDKQISII